MYPFSTKHNSQSQTQNSCEPQYTSSYHESQSSHSCSCPLKTPVYQTDLSPNLAVDLLHHQQAGTLKKYNLDIFSRWKVKNISVK